MAENALISDAVSHCVRGYWAVTHALFRQPQTTGSAAGGARVRQALSCCCPQRNNVPYSVECHLEKEKTAYVIPYCCSRVETAAETVTA